MGLRTRQVKVVKLKKIAPFFFLVAGFLVFGLKIGWFGNESETAGPKEMVVVTKVVDGDSIEIEGNRQVRYIGIDAPEWEEEPESAAKAAARNRELVAGKRIRLEKDVSETDRYGRLLRYVWVGNEMVNETLVREGYARAVTFPPDTRYEERFLAAEKEFKAGEDGFRVPTAVSRKVVFEVPFTAQSPLGEWDDPRQQDGCEEASALMAVAWGRGEKLGGKEGNRNKIVEISDWQEARFGPGHDTSAADTVERIFKGYFNYEKVWVKEMGEAGEIVSELEAGHLVITPMNGQVLGNPYYTAPGPERHMLVVTGFDPGKREFVTNDPGTRRGEGYRYDMGVFWAAIRDYPTGDHLPIEGTGKMMIVVSK